LSEFLGGIYFQRLYFEKETFVRLPVLGDQPRIAKTFYLVSDTISVVWPIMIEALTHFDPVRPLDSYNTMRNEGVMTRRHGLVIVFNGGGRVIRG
jgi:hypothetical protein